MAPFAIAAEVSAEVRVSAPDSFSPEGAPVSEPVPPTPFSSVAPFPASSPDSPPPEFKSPDSVAVVSGMGFGGDECGRAKRMTAKISVVR